MAELTSSVLVVLLVSLLVKIAAQLLSLNNKRAAIIACILGSRVEPALQSGTRQAGIRMPLYCIQCWCHSLDFSIF